MTKYNNYYNLK